MRIPINIMDTNMEQHVEEEPMGEGISKEIDQVQ